MIRSTEDFKTVCQNAAVVWFNNQNNKDKDGNTVRVAHDDIKTVWCVKCLQNYKAIMSIIAHPWGLPNILFEFSYNGDENELYMDVYTKTENRKFGIIDRTTE